MVRGMTIAARTKYVYMHPSHKTDWQLKGDSLESPTKTSYLSFNGEGDIGLVHTPFT